jgi:hypothetical protein
MARAGAKYDKITSLDEYLRSEGLAENKLPDIICKRYKPDSFHPKPGGRCINWITGFPEEKVLGKKLPMPFAKSWYKRVA